jgi:hypothetical protein
MATERFEMQVAMEKPMRLVGTADSYSSVSLVSYFD